METYRDIIGWSSVFFLSIVVHLFSIKWLNSQEGFTDAWPMVFWCSVSWLPTIPWSLIPVIRNWRPISRRDWIRLGIASLLFNIENIVLWIMIQSVPLAVYIICRSSYNLINPLLVRWYQHKPISGLIGVSMGALVGAYAFLIADMTQSNASGTKPWMLVVIVSTSLMTCICSHILEKYFGSVGEGDLEWNIHLVYNLYSGGGFLLLTAPSAYFVSRASMTSIAWGLSCLSGFMFVGYVWSKNKITGFRRVSGNLVMGGIDLSRRVASSVLAYSVLRETLSGLLIGANIMMLASSILIFVSIWRQQRVIARLNSITMSTEDVMELLEPDSNINTAQVCQ